MYSPSLVKPKGITLTKTVGVSRMAAEPGDLVSGSTSSGRSASTMPPADATAGWPAVQAEEVDWRLPAAMQGLVPASAVVRLEARPYRAAIAPEIAALDPADSLSKATIAAAVEAAAEIAAFDRETHALPVPMPTVLLRTESASSSQIENLTANARNLATAALGLATGQNASLVSDNATAMSQALAMPGPLTRDQILDIHAALLSRSQPDIAGRLRTEPVWIGRPDISPHGADFVPPRYQRVPAAIDDLVRFTSRHDINGLILAAVAHAQFETIHPFADGNGRTGRVIVHSLLRATGYTTHTTVPVSAGLLGDVAGYFQALEAYRDGDLEPIVQAFTGSTYRAIVNGRQLAADTVAIHGRWQDVVTARSDSGAWRLAHHLFAQPVVSAAYVEQVLESSKQGAYNAVRVLADAGVLTQTSRDRRNQVWQAKDVLEAMDAFAARALRRTLG